MKKGYYVIFIILLCLGIVSCMKDDEPKEESGIIYREYDYDSFHHEFHKAKVIDGYEDFMELIETNEKNPQLGVQYWKFKINKAGTARILWEAFGFDFWNGCWIEEITINEDLSYSSEIIPLKLPENSKKIKIGIKDDIYDDFTFEYYEP